MLTNELKVRPHKKRKRVGRGDGSGRGTFSGRGGKGQTARTGGTRRPGFVGGQTPLVRQMPKSRGFSSMNRISYQVVNLETLEKFFDNKSKIDKKSLLKKGLISKLNVPVKILGSGDIKKSFEISSEKISKSALEKLTKAKGRFILVANQNKSSDESTKKVEPKKEEKRAKSSKKAESKK